MHAKIGNMQIKTQLTSRDGKRLEIIMRDYGFKSTYEFSKAVLTVFIRANDPREDEILTENLKEILTQEVDTKLNRQ